MKKDFGIMNAWRSKPPKEMLLQKVGEITVKKAVAQKLINLKQNLHKAIRLIIWITIWEMKM